MPIFDSYRVENGQSAPCCIARIIRRILCISTLPSSPFDHFKEEEKDPSATPGLMARLMGLESVPPGDSVELHRKSRSQMTRKKVIPMYQEFEDEKFFILSFDRVGRNVDYPVVERWKSSSRSAKEGPGNRKKHRRRRRHSNKENIDADKTVCEVRRMRNSSNVRRDLKNSSKESNAARNVMESLAIMKLKAEANSENSSPNSVLDCLEFPPDHKESSKSGHEDSRLANSKSRRTLSDELESLKSEERRQIMNDGGGHEEEKQTRVRNCEPKCPEKWDGISKLAAMDVFKSSWFESGMSKNYHLEEIGRDLASGILDHLLSEMLIELQF